MRYNVVRPWMVAMLLLASGPALAQRYVCMQSSQGEWCMELLRDSAPQAVDNFLLNVESGSYTNNIVHYSLPGYFIKAGAYNIAADGYFDPVVSKGVIGSEFGHSNVRGTVSMDKINLATNSSTGFFFNLDDNSYLDLEEFGRFTVFANVVYGMEVIDKIESLKIGDLSETFGSHFGLLPLDGAANTSQVGRSNLVLINRAYSTNVLPGAVVFPYQCSQTFSNDVLTELCDGSVTFPVNVEGAGPYEVTLDLVGSNPSPVLAIRPDSLKPMAKLPTSHAVYNPATKMLLVPSVRTGSIIYDDVQLLLTNEAVRQFTVKNFKRR
ncbi:MAG: peptidylprolyl isomerase [Pseudomonadota bacterium]